MNIVNKQIRRLYEVLDTYVAGIVLTGTEIKSVRDGRVSFRGAFCSFSKDGLYVRSMNIAEYEKGTHYNHEPLRPRKLLLTSSELKKLNKGVKEKGLTIVPVRMFINDKGLAKLEIAMCRGKNVGDKREDLKKRDAERRMSE